MNTGRIISLTVAVLLLLGFFAPTVFANKSSVSIEAPAEVAPGTKITIKLNVAHQGNSFIHHTDWVYLKINGKEVKRWKYGWNSLPDSENFTVTFEYTVDNPVKIEAEAHCNIHGSQGPATVMVNVKK